MALQSPNDLQGTPMNFRSMTLGATALAAAMLAGCNNQQPDPNAVAAAAASAAASAVATQMAAANAAAEHAAKAKAAAKPHAAAQQNHEGNQAHALANTPAVMQPAQVCGHCGVVEAVDATQQKGSGSGVGAVAGGVLGGVLGHQVGGGTGKTVATVVGAVGGGLVGNEVEKRVRSTTEYSVRVRMDDGSTRTLSQQSAPAVGQRVTVDGNTLTPSSAAAPMQQPARSLQTSARS